LQKNGDVRIANTPSSYYWYKTGVTDWCLSVLEFTQVAFWHIRSKIYCVFGHNIIYSIFK